MNFAIEPCAPYDMIQDTEHGPELRREFDRFEAAYEAIMAAALVETMKQQHELHRQVEQVAGVRWG